MLEASGRSTINEGLEPRIGGSLMQNVLMTAMIMLPVLTLSSFMHAQTQSSETTEQRDSLPSAREKAIVSTARQLLSRDRRMNPLSISGAGR